MGRYYRNPSLYGDGKVLGLDISRGVAAASGVYLTKNVGALLSAFLPGVARAVDNIRPGLSVGAMETVGAAAIAGLVARMLPISQQHRGDLVLGGTAIATSDVIASLIGQVNLVQGSPSFAGNVSSMINPASAAKISSKAAPAALPAPASGNGYQNFASVSSGQVAQQAMSTTQLLGVGTMGF